MRRIQSRHAVIYASLIFLATTITVHPDPALGESEKTPTEIHIEKVERENPTIGLAWRVASDYFFIIETCKSKRLESLPLDEATRYVGRYAAWNRSSEVLYDLYQFDPVIYSQFLDRKYKKHCSEKTPTDWAERVAGLPVVFSLLPPLYTVLSDYHKAVLSCKEQSFQSVSIKEADRIAGAFLQTKVFAILITLNIVSKEVYDDYLDAAYNKKCLEIDPVDPLIDAELLRMIVTVDTANVGPGEARSAGSGATDPRAEK